MTLETQYHLGMAVCLGAAVVCAVVAWNLRAIEREFQAWRNRK